MKVKSEFKLVKAFMIRGAWQVVIECPFCGTEQEASVFNLKCRGKNCVNVKCDAIHYWDGRTSHRKNNREDSYRKRR